MNPEIGDTISMDNGPKLGIQQGVIIQGDQSAFWKMGLCILWEDGDIEEFDLGSFIQFDGKILKKAK